MDLALDRSRPDGTIGKKVFLIRCQYRIEKFDGARQPKLCYTNKNPTSDTQSANRCLTSFQFGIIKKSFPADYARLFEIGSHYHQNIFADFAG